MTDILNNDLTLIHTIDDVIPLYQGNGLAAEQQRIGFETEIFIYKIDTDGKPRCATADECKQLVNHLENLGQTPQLEMASAVEYASPAFRVTEADNLNTEIKSAWDVYQQEIRNLGFIASDNAIASFNTLEHAAENLVDRERARGLVHGMKLFKKEEFLKVTLLCTSTQISLSYADSNDLFDILTTAYALTPVFFGVFANYPASIENDISTADYNPRARFYAAFGKDGGIPDSLLKATNGDEFIRLHAQQVFETEMLFYYKTDKNDPKVRRTIWPEKPVKFSELAVIGLNTRTNYDLAETFIYSDQKVCNIRDENGNPIGKRVEIRAFDAGTLGALSSVPFVHALLRDEETNARLKGLLLQYCMTPESHGWPERLREARHAIAEHGGKYLDVPYGTGMLKNFCQSLGVILQLHCQRHPQMAQSLLPVIEICQTGISQAERKKSVHAEKSYQPAQARSLGR